MRKKNYFEFHPIKKQKTRMEFCRKIATGYDVSENACLLYYHGFGSRNAPPGLSAVLLAKL